MRLHLDTNTTAAAANTGSARPAEQTSPSSNSGSHNGVTASGSHDSVAVSGASSAWASSFSDRAARIGQLAAAVQNGTYHVASSAVSQAIVAGAIS
jgi:anti-sigma28 factor (negative regulator of flagellin synthesis)